MCTHAYTIHDSGGKLSYIWCNDDWNYAHCATCQRRENDDGCYNDDGINRLICKIISTSMDQRQYDAAFHWSVIGGLVPQEAARAIAASASLGRYGKPLAQRKRTKKNLYSDMNTCPVCGVFITNRAQTCNRHKHLKGAQ